MPYLERSGMPTLYCELDDYTRIADVKIIRIPSRYHCIATLQPAACAKAVLRFAAQHDGTPCHE